MTIDHPRLKYVYPLGESAKHPIAPPFGVLGALLLLAVRSLLRRPAFPALPMAAHSGASNCRFKDDSLGLHP
jgi:hypothetical protein